MRIGVDVGGTNTDAILMDGRTILAAIKTPTTQDIGTGVYVAIAEVLRASSIHASTLSAVVIGTTHFINAFVEREGLKKVGVIRLCLPACTGVPPMADWPAELRKLVGDEVHMVSGGENFDGQPISRLDEPSLRAVARHIAQAGIESIAVSSVFSPASNSMELHAGAVLRACLPKADITLSHRVGGLGLLERENASIINASLQDLSVDVIRGLESAMRELEIQAPLFLSQNDSTIIDPTTASAYPVRTFASGTTNSMRGANFLAGRPNAIVADIGGTTTDIGVLAHGYPRGASSVVDLAGVRTNFRMPDVVSVGLGGGSLVRFRDGGDDCDVGPRSVGHRLKTESLVFGGTVTTATDVAVAAKYASVGDPSCVEHFQLKHVRAATDRIHATLAHAVSRVNHGPDDLPVVLVGGGSMLVRGRFEGTSETLTPEHADVANAVGAAISQMGADCDRIVSYDGDRREETIQYFKKKVTKQLVENGGDPDTATIVDVEEIQVPYMPRWTVRLRVRGVADLFMNNSDRRHLAEVRK